METISHGNMWNAKQTAGFVFEMVYKPHRKLHTDGARQNGPNFKISRRYIHTHQARHNQAHSPLQANWKKRASRKMHCTYKQKKKNVCRYLVSVLLVICERLCAASTDSRKLCQCQTEMRPCSKWCVLRRKPLASNDITSCSFCLRAIVCVCSTGDQQQQQQQSSHHSSGFGINLFIFRIRKTNNENDIKGDIGSRVLQRIQRTVSANTNNHLQFISSKHQEERRWD